MKLIVGLGNPGSRYAHNRHNVGFMVIDQLLQRTQTSLSPGFSGEVGRVQLRGEPALLLKPMTYMNLSGESVGPCAAFYKVAAEDVIVIHDEMDIPFGSLRVKVGGGHAGHNGLKSIIAHIDKGFTRVRCGIGKAPDGDVVAHVLSDFDSEVHVDLDNMLLGAADAAEAVARDGALAAMNTFNRRKKKSPTEEAE